MFIRRALAVSLSLLFVLSLFFPLKTVMAASSVAPAPAPPVIVGADSGKQPSAPPAVAPPAVPSGDNKKQGASPSPAVPKVEAGLSQEPKQAVSPEAEKKPEAQQPSVAAPPVANEEKKNDSSAAKVQVPSKVQAAGAASSDADLPPWREKLDLEDVKKMAGCEAIADHEHKQIIIRPKNGAKEGVIYVPNGICYGGEPYELRLYSESFAMLAVIQSTQGYTLKFEKRIYLFKSLTPYKGDYSSFFNLVPGDEIYDGKGIDVPALGFVGLKAVPSTLASLGNIADVNTNFLDNLFFFLAHTRIGTEDLNILAKKKYSARLYLNSAFAYMKYLTGYADFSNFQAGTDKYITGMECIFEGSGTDDFVLNFSNKKWYFKTSNGNLEGLGSNDAFKDFKGVLIANNWKDSYSKRGKIKSAWGFYGTDRLFGVKKKGVKKKDAEKVYSLSSLVVTDNPELLKIKKNSKYYKKITISYLDKKEELELPAIYDSRITPTGENDTNQPASADYMKIVKYQVDKAIQAKVQEMRQKYNIPANMQPFPTQAITFTPTSLFQNYKIYCPPAQMEAQPHEQTVYEGQEINKIKITVTSQKEENLPTFAFDQAWQTELAKIGLKFTPAAPDPNNRKVLAAGTISGIIKEDSLQQELDSKGAKTYQITVTGKTTSGKEFKCEQILKITVTRQIATGNKPETSSTLSAYLILAGTLSVILTGRNLAKK